MGIQGLIPFLEKSSRPVSISQFAGCTVAIDAYCWLHKGAFSCADKLARGDKTDVYVNYCMKYVNMLLSYNIKPILVFDGRHLPAKADTEKKRRQNREVNRRRAAELLRQDKPNEARTYLQRCVDVTHTMAVQLMKECRSRNVDCITAPYEADAELAYLNINNIAHIVITEDSDLLLFGCSRVMFKLDLAGNGLLVEQERLHLSMGLTEGAFTMDKFRYMCILSGCDYLASLPKIGLAKALRFIKSTVDPDIHRALSRLGGHLNMNIVVPVTYRDKFLEADAMFRHQPVFDPLTRRLVPLTPPPPGAPPPPLLAKEPLQPSQLQQLAYGNLDPFTLQQVDDWSPEKAQIPGGRSNGWSGKSVAPHKSIWSSDFKPKILVIEKPDPCNVKRTSTSGKVVEQTVDIPQLPKRPAPSLEEEMSALRSQFGCSPHPSKKPRLDEENVKEILDIIDQTPPKSEQSHVEVVNPPKQTHGNPFSKSTPTANKFSGLSKLAQFRKTSPNNTSVVQSRYFGQAAVSQSDNSPDDKSEMKNTLKDLSNVMEKQTKPQSPHKSPFAAPSIDRLTDNNINSLIEDYDKETKPNSGESKPSNGKENSSNETPIIKRETSFRWRPSLSEMFGFKSKSLPSYPAVNGKFVNPSLNKSVDENKVCAKSPSDVNSNRRNPFAKTVKSEESHDGLCSQGSSLNDSLSDSLTPETNSEELVLSPPIVIKKPQMKVGLSKKTNNCQKSLLTMFAFKPKPKIQR
ncbi:exonuclease 1 isoform X2 [Macrosteles quadrilineatus]|uniref:exonuclease 1 isoform X2 n=1 Tax=Macrosteles quadrilineatus TaxID=74068 RepID=UPI0023E0B28B|nr:exonuclease 1 isoform X2 [Macrosteles quadrilineatus]